MAYLQIIDFKRIFHFEPSILGYPILETHHIHTYIYVYIYVYIIYISTHTYMYIYIHIPINYIPSPGDGTCWTLWLNGDVRYLPLPS